ncbi:hypothetical protein [Pseudophaeobacter sp. EL27]|uniref:hypothetical protein n=1 Tax=Pseudophaeobacter sp. EL27 TaxID=2107580 RepID=UPI000EFB1DD7|nr:hypothetical protein [Pseudophaeobacter sp. EL27]
MALKSRGSPKVPAEVSDQEKYQARNRLVLFTFVAFFLGFITALYLGAAGQTDLQKIPAWLTAIASTGATAISLVAVYLVYQTLEATRETLVSTREMSKDQRRIGEAQIRPFLLFEGQFFHSVDGCVEGYIKLVNYGTAPATKVRIGVDVFIAIYPKEDEEQGAPPASGVLDSAQNLLEVPVVPPNGEVKVPYESFHSLDRESEELTAWFYWSYSGHDGTERYAGTQKTHLFTEADMREFEMRRVSKFP